MANGGKTERLVRLLRIVREVRMHRYDSAEELASCLGVSRRTLFRDLRTLRKVDIVVCWDPDHGYIALLPRFLTDPSRTSPTSRPGHLQAVIDTQDAA
jgi:predicted DNA-binding transcriptional regulator YafY